MNKFKFTLYSLIVVTSLLLILYGINVFPTPGTDSKVFLPPALLYAKGLGLYNPLYDITFIYGLYADTAHFFQFNYYVPFFPMILGILSKANPHIKTIFFICSLFSVTNLLLYCSVICSLLPDRLTMSLKILVLGSIAYLATFILPTIGRPENLSSLIAFVIYILYNKNNLNKTLYNVVICILFSVLLSTQIICFYFCALFFITQEILNSDNTYKCILHNAIRFIIIIALFLFILSLSPNGILNTLNGIKAHGSWALTRSDRSIHLFIYYWLLTPLSCGFLLIFLLCAIIYIKSAYKRAKTVRKEQLIYISILQLLLIYGVCKFILYASPTVYNATQFIFIFIVYLFRKIFSTDLLKYKKTIYALLYITFFAGNIMFLRWFVLYVTYKTNGKDYDSAKAIVNQFTKANRNVYITSALWPLIDNPNDVKFIPLIRKKGDILIIQQVYSGSQGINECLKGCTIIYDWRTNEKTKILGVQLTNTPQCYSFIVGRVN